MIDHFLIGVVLLIIGAALLYIGVPNKAGQSPRFLRFEASLVLYPPLIMVCIALGAAQIASAIFK